MWPSGVSRKKIESQPKVSDAGLSAPVIGTSRISIADSPESLVNILTRRMPVYRGSGPSRSRRSVGGLPAHLARVGKGLPPSLWTTSRKQFATLELKPSLSEEAGRSRICIHAGRKKSRGTRRGIATFTFGGETKMCILCDKGFPQNHARSQLGRRDFLKTAAAGGAAAGLGLFAARPATAQGDDAPEDSGGRGRRYIIRGGAAMTMDPSMPNKGEF